MNYYIGENTVIKGNVLLGNNVSIWHNAVIRCEAGSVTIGDDTNIQDLVMIHTGFPNYSVSIGKGTTVGHSAIVHGCTVGDNCIIGMGSIIMNGAVIGNNCIVGAGSLITENKQFPDNALILGSPAKVIRQLTEAEICKNKENAQHYIKLAAENLNRSDF